MAFDINRIPNKVWAHGTHTDVAYASLIMAWPDMIGFVGYIYKTTIYPDYLTNTWYVAMHFRNDNGEVILIDDVKDFPSDRLKTELLLLTR